MKKRLLASFLSLVLILTLLPTAALATDTPKSIYVNASYTDGSADGTNAKPYTTIAEALERASAGDTIKVIAVKGHEYDAFTVSSKANLTIEGITDGSGNKPVIKTNYNESPVTVYCGSGAVVPGQGMTGLKLSNLEFKNYGHNNDWFSSSISFNGATGTNISGIVIDDCDFTVADDATYTPNIAVFLSTDTFTFTNNTVTGYNNAIACMADGQTLKTATITGNTFNVTVDALSLYHGVSDESAAGTIIFTGNTIISGQIELHDYANSKADTSGSAIKQVFTDVNTSEVPIIATAIDQNTTTFKTSQDAGAPDVENILFNYSSVEQALDNTSEDDTFYIGYSANEEKPMYTNTGKDSYQDENGVMFYTYVAELNGTTCATLADAVGIANDNDIIYIYDDAILDSTINAQKVLTFEGVIRSDGSKPTISSSSGGIFSQTGNAQYTLENLELEATTAGQWYIYHRANTLTVRNCDFTTADNVTYTGNVIMGEGSPETDEDYALVFTNNTILANSRAALTGIGNNSVITGNDINLISERYNEGDSRTSIMALTAVANKGAVTITGNTFRNANRALAVDNSTLAADDLTYNENRFFDVRYAFELDPEKNAEQGVFDLNNNYYEFNGTVSAPKVEDASSEGSHFGDGEDSTEYVIDDGEESFVRNDVYYVRPSMDETDLNTYVPPVSTPTRYTITTPSDVTGGNVSVSPSQASYGSTVTITVDPDEGYELDELTVTDASGNDVSVKKVSDTKYTFTMPRSRVTVEATFAEIVEEHALVFVDVPASAYYYDAVYWAAENGVTYGTSATTFSPDVIVSRAQMVTFLWRAYGSPEPESSVNPFTDVSSSAYYYDAVLWAVENGVTNGTSATTFSPEVTVTRAQAVTFQWRAAGSPAVTGGSFADVEADAYYANAVTWAVANGITNGTGGSNFSPDVGVSRAQAVTFLYRQLG